jgi:hypothetical protein
MNAFLLLCTFDNISFINVTFSVSLSLYLSSSHHFTLSTPLQFTCMSQIEYHISLKYTRVLYIFFFLVDCHRFNKPCYNDKIQFLFTFFLLLRLLFHDSLTYGWIINFICILRISIVDNKIDRTLIVFFSFLVFLFSD